MTTCHFFTDESSPTDEDCLFVVSGTGIFACLRGKQRKQLVYSGSSCTNRSNAYFIFKSMFSPTEMKEQANPEYSPGEGLRNCRLWKMQY